MDRHFTALWDHGHINFWSMATLGELPQEAGFLDLRFERVVVEGRIGRLATPLIHEDFKGLEAYT
jgi:2-polyprenyl-6-hydroxyphenyl methylase/3-demethylubiquinone-9 3-methyltransferase